MKYYTLSLTTLFTLLLLVGCGDPEPEVNSEPKIIAPICTIDKLSAPNWCCDGNLNSRYVSVYGHNKDKKLAKDITYLNFQEKLFNYLKEEITSKKSLKLSTQDIRSIANTTILEAKFMYEKWKGNEFYVLYKIKKSILNELLQSNIEKYKHTRVYENCFKTGKVRLEKSCKKQIKNFLQSTPLKEKRTILIEVHTDKAGSSKNNLAISKRRAYAAASSLYYKEYKYSKVLYTGFGETQLLLDKESKNANIINRRVVVLLKDKHYKVPKKRYKKYVYRTKKRAVSSSVSTPLNVIPTANTRDMIGSLKSKSSKRKTQKRVKNVNLVRYTGKADTGWMYFGKKELSQKFYISCADDKPLKVKRKAISRSKKREFITGLYDKRISGNFGKNYVEIYPVYMYENGYLPQSNPIVTLYGNERNIQRFQTTVNTYRGKKGILYRIFINGHKNMECMDLVIPYNTKEVSYGSVYMNEKDNSLKKFKFIRE